MLTQAYTARAALNLWLNRIIRRRWECCAAHGAQPADPHRPEDPATASTPVWTPTQPLQPPAVAAALEKPPVMPGSMTN